MYDYGHEPEALSGQLQNYEQIAIIKAQRAQKRYFKRLRWFLIVALIAGSAYLLDKRPASISLDKALLALGITWVGFLPSLQYLLDRNRPPMPFLPLVGIFYATSFGLPMFASDQKLPGRWSLADVSETALVLALLGVAGMNIAFFASKASVWQKVSPIRIAASYPLGKLLTILWLLLLSHLAFLYVPFVRSIPSVGQLLNPVGYVAYGMFYIIGSRGKLSSLQTWLLLGVCAPLECIPRFASGSLAQMMLLGLFMVLVVWFERKRIPVILITITLLIFLIFNSVKGEYRYLVWAGGEYINASPIEKVQLFIELAVKQYQNPNPKSQEEESATDSAVSRSAHIITLSAVIEDTPSKVPYWNGETYLPLLTSYIPRALWPDKPTETIGNVFGRRYNYLGKNDFVTSFNLPWIVEMYVNFGSWGILIGMSLVGVSMAFLNQKFNHPDMGSLEFVIGCTILFSLIYQESNLSLMTGGILTLFLALYVIFKIGLGSQRRRVNKGFESN